MCVRCVKKSTNDEFKGTGKRKISNELGISVSTVNRIIVKAHDWLVDLYYFSIFNIDAMVNETIMVPNQFGRVD